MGQDVGFAKSICRFEPRYLAVGLLFGCFLATFAYFSFAKFDTFHFFPVNSASTMNVPSPSPSLRGDLVQKMASSDSEQVDLYKELQDQPAEGTDRNISSINSANSPIASKHVSRNEESQQSVQDFDSDIKEEFKEITEACKQKPELCVAGKDSTSSELPIDAIQQDTTKKMIPRRENKKQLPLCDLSQKRIDKCEIEGDVRIFGKNATITWVPSPESEESPDYERKVWHIKPYPRKEDKRAMDPVRMVTVKSVNSPDEAPACTNHSDLPAIVFSDRGYEDNYFHDFTDVLVPIFTTAQRFQGEVIFLVSDLMIYRIAKFVRVYKNLTKYDLINFDCDEEIRCYKKVYVGLTSHDDFDIDPERITERYTLVDFTKFMRSIYGLKRETAEIPIQKTLGRKPRLLIVARAKTRRFVNLDDIIHAAERLGFEVVATEAADGLDRFSLIVNSCDVMMGVHGAGLSNMVFLPINAVFIQILPWGDLEWVGNYIKRPAEKMKLKYLQYDITQEESTLIEDYPRNHTVFTDPMSIQQKGWGSLKEVFLVKQNVRLNIERFRPTLQKALEHLNSVDS